jgi:hypothetical protein
MHYTTLFGQSHHIPCIRALEKDVGWLFFHCDCYSLRRMYSYPWPANSLGEIKDGRYFHTAGIRILHKNGEFQIKMKFFQECLHND